MKGFSLDRPRLLPDGVEVHRVRANEVFWTEPGREQVAVTTDPDYFEENADSLELWSPGNPAFPEREDGQVPDVEQLDSLL